MSEKVIPNEQAIIDEILRRKDSQEKRIPAEKMRIFKGKLGEEIQRTGSLTKVVVDQLLHQLKNAR